MKNMIFFQIINVILSKCKGIIENCQEDKLSLKLFLKDFISILIYRFISTIDSLRFLATDLKGNNLGIKEIPFSTLRDGFTRFNYRTFQEMFFQLVSSLGLLTVPELKLLGQICLVDGSIFKLSIRCDWAQFRKKVRGIKLHLFWNLNNMNVQDLRITSAIKSEIDVLKGFINGNVTYIMDRGYISTLLFGLIVDSLAHFVIRLRKNMENYLILKETIFEIHHVGKVKERIIIFHADEKLREYRLIIFNSNGKKFRLLTDRKDIKIEEIIMLYASRWQIELIFRFMKRTVNGIHILSESENGLNIQFYIMAIANLVLLGFKQKCLMMIKEKPISLKIENLMENPVSEIGNRLKQQWKLGKHWLRKLRNSLNKVLNLELAEVFAK